MFSSQFIHKFHLYYAYQILMKSKLKMNNQKIIKKRLTILSIILLAASVACTPAQDSVETENINQQLEEPAVSSESTLLHSEVQNESNGELTDAEVEGLLFMREEEKLAGDVYRYLYDLWGSVIFENIAVSEDMHTESVLSLLNAYGIEDPFIAEPGQFSNADLQALYDQLIVQGSQSLKDALLVGAAIEEIDILDLEKHIAQTDNEDINFVYENLIDGSENHLRGFVRVLGNQAGAVYSPQYLTQEQYDAIIQGASGPGNGIGGQNGQGVGQGVGLGKDS